MVFEGNTVDRTAADSFFSFFFSLGLLLAMTPRYRVRTPGPRLAYRNILAGFWGNCKYLEILHRGSPEVFRSSSYTLYLPQLKTMAFNAEGEKVEANFCKKRQMKQKKRNHARAGTRGCIQREARAEENRGTITKWLMQQPPTTSVNQDSGWAKQQVLLRVWVGERLLGSQQHMHNQQHY